MNKIAVIVYVVLAVLLGLSYLPTRDYLVSTSLDYITVSNLTVNYVLLYMIVGGVCPWLGKKLFPKASKWIGIPFTGVVVVTMLLVFSMFGYRLRW